MGRDIAEALRHRCSPSPNLPRVCCTPYFVPDKTLPSSWGMSSCGMPVPLSCVGSIQLAVLQRGAVLMNPMVSCTFTVTL